MNRTMRFMASPQGPAILTRRRLRLRRGVSANGTRTPHECKVPRNAFKEACPTHIPVPASAPAVRAGAELHDAHAHGRGRRALAPRYFQLSRSVTARLNTGRPGR